MLTTASPHDPTYLRIQTSRDRRVGRAFDDGAAVGEERHLVWIVPEAQDELVVPDRAMRRQSPGDFGEVDGPLPLVNLHRVASAQRNVRAAFAGEMHEVVLLAGAASGYAVCRS